MATMTKTRDSFDLLIDQNTNVEFQGKTVRFMLPAEQTRLKYMKMVREETVDEDGKQVLGTAWVQKVASHVLAELHIADDEVRKRSVEEWGVLIRMAFKERPPRTMFSVFEKHAFDLVGIPLMNDIDDTSIVEVLDDQAKEIEEATGTNPT